MCRPNNEALVIPTVPDSAEATGLLEPRSQCHDAPAVRLRTLLPEICLANTWSRGYCSENARHEPEIGSRSIADVAPRLQIIDCGQGAQKLLNAVFVLKEGEHCASRMHCQGGLDVPATVLPLPRGNERGQQLVRNLFSQDAA